MIAPAIAVRLLKKTALQYNSNFLKCKKKQESRDSRHEPVDTSPEALPTRLSVPGCSSAPIVFILATRFTWE